MGTTRIGSHWEDMYRIAVPMHAGEVSGHVITRMLSRDGNPPISGCMARPLRTDLQDAAHPAPGRWRTLPAGGQGPGRT
ncbi:transposase [Nocardia gipuzkoensis]|uniref:transposase n=1 Tax=Nocardia gipuzkoensis TaxID=2749991 RepID=UPI001E502BE6|nr:transposase [Nocardia gipuzkoensis]UGT72360.1 transposase [Nocardia gipuzkoensis]